MSVAISYTFSPTTTIQSGQVNQNFTDLVNYINNTVAVPDMVIGWKGAVGSIPTGWTLDNDLKDKFIVGAGNSYAVGATGGKNTHALSIAELPAHAHEVQLYKHAETSGTRAEGTGSLTTQGKISTANQGSGTAHENRPPYYSLAWIRKT